MKNNMENKTCCEKCLSVNTFDHWCSIPNCPCHKPSVTDTKSGSPGSSKPASGVSFTSITESEECNCKDTWEGVCYHKKSSLEPIEDWQKKFLDTGTLLGFGDLSGMIGVISSILSSQSSKIKQEMVDKIDKVIIEYQNEIVKSAEPFIPSLKNQYLINKLNVLGRKIYKTIINNSN